MDPKNRINLLYLMAAVFGILLMQSMLAGVGHVRTVPYSEFEQMLKDGKIEEVAITNGSLRGTLAGSTADKPQHVVAGNVDPAQAERLERYGVRFFAVKENTWLRDILSWVVPMLLFFGLWMFVFRRMAEKHGMGDGMMAIGKSKAKVYVEKDTKVTFTDVAGVDEAKAELQEIVTFLKSPEQYGRLGARLPKGILLVGPPGTGKTLLARAVAGEAGVPFFSISGAEFVEMFVGVGAARVRDLFEQARAKAPAIIFIDEIDALGRARGAFPMSGGHDEKEQTLNQLLSEMDGFDPRQGLVLLAATNRPEILDPALLRAGRFDRQVLVDRPDRIGRAQILGVHLTTVRVAPGVDAQQIAALTPGFSGADLANLVNEAALLATRRGAETVDQDDFTQAIERIVAGLEKHGRLLNPQERRIVAYHELGHAFVALSLKGSDAVQKVSIIPRGIGALGYTLQRPTEDRFVMTREELHNRMAVLLGGRAAEQTVFGEVSTGASDDLAKATDIARSMVTRFGMVPAFGQVVFETQAPRFLDTPVPMPGERSYSEETAREIDRAVRELLDAAYKTASDIVRSRRSTLDEASKVLLERETLLEKDLLGFMGAPVAAALKVQAAA
ncbi:MAG: ATP-dependent zinc metalloprotease FtsH [Sinimarinibacterium sp.]|jgi:cell division protease FtsH